jgi:hypothetical protein
MSVRLDDLVVYRRLIQFHEELDDLSKRCWSVASAAALEVAKVMIRLIASAVWQQLWQ